MPSNYATEDVGDRLHHVDNPLPNSLSLTSTTTHLKLSGTLFTLICGVIILNKSQI